MRQIEGEPPCRRYGGDPKTPDINLPSINIGAEITLKPIYLKTRKYSRE